MRTLRRFGQLLLGCLVLGTGVELCLASGLGTDAMGVLVGGVSHQSGMSFGVANAVVGIVVVLLLWIVAKRRPQVGTLLQPVLVGQSVNLAALLHVHGRGLLAEVGILVAGVVLVGVGAAVYLGAGLGSGPFDGVPLEIARRSRLSVSQAFLGVLVVSFLLGMALGGVWGVGSALAAVVVGPIIGRLLPHMSVKGSGEEIVLAEAEGSEVHDMEHELEADEA